MLNSSSVFYFLENREESPLQCLFTNTLSCTTMSVFSPKILSKATATKKKKGKTMLKFFLRIKIATKESE